MAGSPAITSSGGIPFGLNVRAWVLFRGGTGAIVKAAGVSSVVRNSAGNYAINLTSAMVDQDYVTVIVDHAASGASRSPFNAVTQPVSTSQLNLFTYNATVLTDSSLVWLGIAG
ncbi:hypothetical protein ACS5PN_03825 [Roseateles sp. NT4]|uniref:hypothetical protein n=1 Tax=Roseateles sp. NT4 TaxID=3453715 RepID=UPI003EEF3ECD